MYIYMQKQSVSFYYTYIFDLFIAAILYSLLQIFTIRRTWSSLLLLLYSIFLSTTILTNSSLHNKCLNIFPLIFSIVLKRFLYFPTLFKISSFGVFSVQSLDVIKKNFKIRLCHEFLSFKYACAKTTFNYKDLVSLLYQPRECKILNINEISCLLKEFVTSKTAAKNCQFTVFHTGSQEMLLLHGIFADFTVNFVLCSLYLNCYTS